MKLIGHLRWVDFLRRFNQGIRSVPTDVKKENVNISIDKPTGDKTIESDLTQMERIQLAGGIAKPIGNLGFKPTDDCLNGVVLIHRVSACHLMSRNRVQWSGLLREKI